MGAGDFAKEEFTPEELEALGEATAEVENAAKEGTGEIREEADAEDAEAADSSKTGDEEKTAGLSTAEKEVAQSEGVRLIGENGRQYLVDDEGAKIPVERWRKNYARTQADIRAAVRNAGEINQKLNLLKELGADRYYGLYPDEKPEGYESAGGGDAVSFEDAGLMRVQGGRYDGWLLKDVAVKDPLAANLILNQYLDTKRSAAADEQKRREEFDRNFIGERDSFLIARARELFGKADNFTEEEKAKLADVYAGLSKWMIENRVPHYNMEDAWFLMNRDRIISTARATAAEAAVKKVTEPGVRSIGSGGAGSKATGFESYLTMTEDDLADTIERMSDAEQERFYRDAPKALRDKYPSLPW